MISTTENEARVMLTLFKDFTNNYNANNLAKKIGLSPMGTLKILKKLKKQGILRSEQLGKATFYKPDIEKEYTQTYIKFLLQKEAEQAKPRIKRWVKELRPLKNNAEIGLLFGSVIKDDQYKDVDVLLVIKPSQNKEINDTIKEINRINTKKIHLVKQTTNDLKKNLKKKDKVILSILRNGIVLFGYEKMIRMMKDVTR